MKFFPLQKIRNKILLVTLLSLLSVTLLLAPLCIWGLAQARQTMLRCDEELSAAAARDSYEILLKKNREQLLSIAGHKAQLVYTKLKLIEDATRQSADMLTLIQSSPANFHPREIAAYDSSMLGKFTAFYLLTANTTLESVQADIYLNAAVLDFVKEMLAVKNDIRLICVGSADGYSIIADKTIKNYPAHFDARLRNWYRGATRRNAAYWTDVYRSIWQEEMISCAVPFYRINGDNQELRGVVSLDVTINDEIRDILDNGKITPNCYVFLVSERGDIVSNTQDGGEIRDTLAWGISDLMIGGNREKRVLETELGGRPVIVALYPLKNSGWSFGITLPLSDLTVSAMAIHKSIFDLAIEKIGGFNRQSAIVILFALLLIAIIALSVIALAIHFSAFLTRPITTLAANTQLIANGNYQHCLTMPTGAEIVTLQSAFQRVVNNVRQATVEKERNDAEFNALKKIHYLLLPEVTEIWSHYEKVEAAAVLWRGQETNLSFYDCLQLSDSRQLVVVASVFDRNIGAALLLIIVKTLLRIHAQTNASPAEIITKVNQELCSNYEPAMYVTATVVEFNLVDQDHPKITYVTAGNRSPLYNHGSGFRYLENRPGVALGIAVNAGYRAVEKTLTPGDTLFIYSDGTDAKSSDNLLPLLNSISSLVATYRTTAPTTADWINRLTRALNTRQNAIKNDVALICWRLRETEGQE